MNGTIVANPIDIIRNTIAQSDIRIAGVVVVNWFMIFIIMSIMHDIIVMDVLNFVCTIMFTKHATDSMFIVIFHGSAPIPYNLLGVFLQSGLLPESPVTLIRQIHNTGIQCCNLTIGKVGQAHHSVLNARIRGHHLS